MQGIIIEKIVAQNNGLLGVTRMCLSKFKLTNHRKTKLEPTWTTFRIKIGVFVNKVIAKNNRLLGSGFDSDLRFWLKTDNEQLLGFRATSCYVFAIWSCHAHFQLLSDFGPAYQILKKIYAQRHGHFFETCFFFDNLEISMVTILRDLPWMIL
ncbi:hypothetical protein ACJX0J_014916, partial [Zea mays]